MMRLGGRRRAFAWVAGALWAGARLRSWRRRLDLRGRTVLVTGGGRGLGFALARQFLEAGAAVSICGPDASELQAARDTLQSQFQREVTLHVCDTSDAEQVQRMADSVLATHGHLDILVNNAGQCFIGPIAELRAPAFEAALRNIFWAQFHPTMAFLPHMRGRRFGRIVNVSSIGGLVGLPHQSAYAAGKFAVSGFSQSLRTELARDGILVTTVAPPPLRNGAPLYVHYAGRAEQEYEVFTRALTSRLTSMDNERAARRIVRAVRQGLGLCTLSLRNWAITQINGLAPNLTSDVLALVNRLLPAPLAGTGTPLLEGLQVAKGPLEADARALTRRTGAHAERYRPLGSPLAPGVLGG